MEALQKIAVDIAKKYYFNLLETRKKMSLHIWLFTSYKKKGCSQVEQPRNQDMIFPRW